jgi:hypothetical protein
MTIMVSVDAWTKETLDELVRDKWQESIVVEFKRDLGTRVDRKEVAKDVCAFANTSGGWIVYGVDEQTNAQGIKVAGSIVPLTDPNTAQRIDDIIAEAIVPPVRYRSKTIPYGTGSCVLLRIEPSTSALHMVQAYDEFRYYRRTEKAARPMPEPEVRQALEQIARREADGDRTARELFDRVSDVYPSPFGWLALSTGIGNEVVDPRRVRDATVQRYLHREYATHGQIEDLGYRATIGDHAYDFGVARDGSTWLKWPLDGLGAGFKPLVLIDHLVRLAATAADLWNECGVNPMAPRLALQLATRAGLRLIDGEDRYRPAALLQSKWLTFVTSRSDIEKGARVRLARSVADRVYQIMGIAQCPFFGDDGMPRRHLQNEFRDTPW